MAARVSPGRAAVDHHVMQDSALRSQQRRRCAAAYRNPVDIGGQNGLQEGRCLLTVDLDEAFADQWRKKGRCLISHGGFLLLSDAGYFWIETLPAKRAI